MTTTNVAAANYTASLATTTTTTTVALSDEPRLSSAALSITMRHHGENCCFRPEYTHQIVGTDESWGPMYQPFQSVLDTELQKWKKKQQQQQNTTTNDDNATESSSPSSPPSSTADLLHKSHQHHQDATHELSIEINLSPSCQHCTVDVHQRRKKGLLTTRPVVQTNESDKHNNSNSDNKQIPVKGGGDDQDERQPYAKRLKVSEDHGRANDGSSFIAVRKDEEFVCTMRKALPDVGGNNTNKDTIKQDVDGYLLELIGDVLEEYHTLTSSSLSTSSSFVMTLADGRQSDDNINTVWRFHDNVQRLALWYIENADDVDISDQSNGGYWKVLYLFQKHSTKSSQNNNQQQGQDEDDHTAAPETTTTTTNATGNYRYSLVGYMTLYHFISLFHKPEGGIIVRICQALLLPPYQAQGHGERLLRALYKLAQSSSDNNNSNNCNTSSYKIVQINVEDPAPGFVALRNKTDFRYVFENLSRWKENPKWPRTMCRPFEVPTSAESAKVGIMGMLNDDNALFCALSETDAMYASAVAKLTVRQIQIVREILILWKMSCYVDLKDLLESGAPVLTSNIGLGDDKEVDDNDCVELLHLKADLFKKSRLMIKRRLNKENRDELSCLPTKDNQKARLATLFETELKHYLKILSSLKK
jgi:GNAT superfamily N-acetyltransferase